LKPGQTKMKTIINIISDYKWFKHV